MKRWIPLLLVLVGCSGNVDGTPPAPGDDTATTAADTSTCSIDDELSAHAQDVCASDQWVVIMCDQQISAAREWECQGPKWDTTQDLGWLWCCK